MFIEKMEWPDGKAYAAMISVNLDAEYFKQNGSEEEGTKQHRERMSLLDKLMGKKKTLL